MKNQQIMRGINGITESQREGSDGGKWEIDKDKKKVLSDGLKNEMHSLWVYDCLFPTHQPHRVRSSHLRLKHIITLQSTQASELKLFAKLLRLFDVVSELDS